MFKFFKQIRIFLFGKPTEIQYVESALRRYKDEKFDLDSSFNPTTDCCQECMTGGRYCDLLDKIERVEAQLIRLKRSKIKKFKKAERRRLWQPPK